MDPHACVWWHRKLCFLLLLDFLGVGSDSGERSSRVQVGTSESQRLDVKNQPENIQWHPRYASRQYLLCYWLIVGCLHKPECEPWTRNDLIYLISYFAGELRLVLYTCQEEWRNQVGGSHTRSSLKVCADSVSRNLAPEERIIRHGYLLLKWQRLVSCLHSSLCKYVEEIFTGRYNMIHWFDSQDMKDFNT